MKIENVALVICGLKHKPLNTFWNGEDDIDNDAEDFEEEWLPQDAW